MQAYFKKSFRGYNRPQVDEYIISLSDTYAQKEKEFEEQLRALESENTKLKAAIIALHDEAEAEAEEHRAELEKEHTEYEALCTEVGEKMVIADKRASDIIRNAEKEAAIIIAQAHTDAENETKAIRAEAEAEAERLISETERKCSSLAKAAEEFRAKQEEMNRSMYETEKSMGDAIDKLRKDIRE